MIEEIDQDNLTTNQGSNMPKNEKFFIILLCIFAGSLTLSSILANKIITIFGFFVPAGVLGYSITFFATDTISEIWGKKRANFVVIGGFFALLIALILIMLSLFWEKAPFWEGDAAYSAILGSTPRIIIGSFVAYLVSQFTDVWTFHFFKRITNSKHLWLRNNLSTMSSQLIDTVLFITIAFYGVLPIGQMIFGQWLIKCIIAGLDTPIVYAVVWYIKSQIHGTPSDMGASVS